MNYTYFKFPRNVYLLFASQIIGGSAASIVVVLGGIIGAILSPTPTLATLPITAMVVGIATTTIPAALLMKRVGRRNGFLFAAILALCGALIAAYAVTIHNFFLFCLGTFLIGANGAFVQQYRFAAIESVSPSLTSSVVGFVLFAGIISGFLGPEIAKHFSSFDSFPEYTGPFLVLSVLIILSVCLLSFLKKTKIHEDDVKVSERSLSSIITKPHFFISVIAAALGFSVMTFIMTATPLHLHTSSHYSIDNIVFILQSHIIAMFLPSLITGILIKRFGVFRILLLGLASFLCTVILAVQADSLKYYWGALVLLGIGWNFLYISSTVLLSQSHSAKERFKAQGVNDFMVVLTQMLASFLAGSVLYNAGWVILNMITLPLIVIAFIVFVSFRKKLNLR